MGDLFKSGDEVRNLVKKTATSAFDGGKKLGEVISDFIDKIFE